MNNRILFFGTLFLIALSRLPLQASAFYEENSWLELLYYQKSSSGFKSLADNPKFFITPNGNRDPRGEYEASLKKVQIQDETFRKTFPLRYKRIAKANNLEYRPLSPLNTDIAGVMIAFPNRYMANPASMFGHLFLVLKSKQGLPDSTILHYIADTGEVNQYSYIYKGIAGEFKGWFLTEPYYRKIKEYTYRDDREVSFYDLKLTQDQTEDLQLHAIELKQTYFHYYFFDQNCAFFIGKLLNVIYGTPVQGKGPLVLPSDIINTLERKRLLENAYYRGASTKQFSDAYYELNTSDRKQVIQLILKSQYSVPTDSRTLKPFLYISDYVLNNYGSLADSVRKNRILAYTALREQHQATIRPELSKQTSIRPIASKAIGLDYGSSKYLRATYSSIYYGNSGSFQELESRLVNCFSPGLSVKPHSHTQFEFTAAELSNISAYNDVLNSNSWHLKSWFAYSDTFHIEQSFEYGRAYRPFAHTLVTGLAGLNLSNYNKILDTSLTHTAFQPTVRVELAQLINQTIKVSLGYDYRFEKNYIQAGLSLKRDDYESSLYYISAKEKSICALQILRKF